MVNKRVHLIVAFIAAGLSLGTFSVLVILLFTKTLNNYPFTSIGLVLVTTFFGIIAVLGISRYNQQLTIDKTVELENLHNLGKKSNLYNLYAFERDIQKKRFKPLYLHKKQYLIAFTGTNFSVTQNLNKNQNVNEFIAAIVELLGDVFGKKSEFKTKRHIFCFNRGIFYIYSFLDNENQLKDLLDRITKGIYKKVNDEKINVWVQPFFGIYETNSDDSLIEGIENAALARSHAEKNFESVTYYDPSFRKTSNIDDVMEILEGLKNREFVVYYQPKFNLNINRFDSSEALIRWNSPKYGLLPPSRFIPKAELGGIVHELDTYVFTRVCEDLAELKKRGRRMNPVSINFSLFEFYDAKFMNKIFEILDQYRVEPQYVQIEITETTSLANPFVAISIIKKMKDKGIKVLMDDFGVGFSEIGNLRTIPFDGIKIDKSFTDVLETDQKTYSLVKMLIQMCHESNIEVTCEGVSNINQVEILRKLKCDVIQGYYYSKPILKSDYVKLLENNKFERKTREKSA